MSIRDSLTIVVTVGVALAVTIVLLLAVDVGVEWLKWLLAR